MDPMVEEMHSTKNELSAITPNIPRSGNTGVAALDEALDWLCKGTRSVIDFGCGDGMALFFCALRGTKRHTGIDPSPAAIRHARENACLINQGKYQFIEGGPEALRGIKSASFHAAILSDIMDNLAPDDAQAVLEQIRRILRPRGRVLVQLSPYRTASELCSRDIRAMAGDMFDCGLLLWNLPTEKWAALLRQYFTLEGCTEAYDPERAQLNRLFTLQVPARRTRSSQ